MPTTPKSATTENKLPPGIRFVDSHPLGRDFLVQRFELDNGLDVIIMEDHASPLFAYHTWFKVGSRYEKPGTTGIAHLFEHLMFKATKNHGEEYLTHQVEERGGNINAGTSKDWTYYRINIPSSNLDLVASLESDRMTNLILSDDQINTEREVVREERRFRTEDNIDGRMDEQLYASAYKAHSYGWPIIGTKKDLDNIKRDDCLNFYKTYYAPNNATVVIIGDVDTNKALETVKKYYAPISASTVPPIKTTLEPAQREERRQAIANKSILEDKLIIAYHVPNVTHEDRVVLEVLNALLVEGKSARLYRKLVDDLKIATAVNGYVDSYADPGLFKIYVSMSSGHKAESAEKVIYAEIDKMRRELAEARELQRTKNSVEAYSIRVLKTNEYKAFMLGYFHTLQGDYRQLFSETDRYRAVEANDIKRVAETYLNATNRTVVIARAGS